MTDRDEMYRRFLEWRGVESPCATCRGGGRSIYASTATWRGGIGGCVVTEDVCDVCWGTGDARRRGEDLRALRDRQRDEIAQRAMDLWADAAGCRYAAMREEASAIAEGLDRLSRGRKPRPRWFATACASLAKTLRDAVARTERLEAARRGAEQ